MRYHIGPLTREQSEEQMTGFVRHRDRGGLGLWAGEYKASGAFIGFIDRLYQNDWPEGAHKTEMGWGRLDRACCAQSSLRRCSGEASATGLRS